MKDELGPLRPSDFARYVERHDRQMSILRDGHDGAMLSARTCGIRGEVTAQSGRFAVVQERFADLVERIRDCEEIPPHARSDLADELRDLGFEVTISTRFDIARKLRSLGERVIQDAHPTPSGYPPSEVRWIHVELTELSCMVERLG